MNTMPRISTLIFGLALAAGCSKSSPDAVPPEPQSEPESTPTRAPVAGSPTATGVYLDAVLTAVCELPSSDDFFVYEPAAPDAHADALLVAVAGCVRTGPLAGRRLELVAHAGRVDADGHPLGASRADPVRATLVKGGVLASDIVTHVEVGDEDAPLDAEGWPSERRVDVRVATRHAK